MKYEVFFACLLLLPIVFLISCNLPGHEIEEIEEDSPDSSKSANNIEIKNEIELPKPEIKEDISPKEKIVFKKYVIQIGAFYSEEHAAEFSSAAKIKTQYNFYYKLTEGLFKVRYGDFDSKSEALSVQSKIRELGYADVFVIESAK